MTHSLAAASPYARFLLSIIHFAPEEDKPGPPLAAPDGGFAARRGAQTLLAKEPCVHACTRSRTQTQI